MNRSFKMFFVSLCGILFLLLVIAVLLPIFFNPRYHKSGIENYISSMIGLPCSLGGRVDFSLLPQTSLTFSELTITNPDGFEQNEFLFVKSGQVLMDSWSFFSGKAEVSRVMLTGVRARFEENQQNLKNWSNLTHINSALAIDLLVVTDGDIVVTRKPSNRQYHYSDMSLVLSGYSFNQSSGFETEGVFNGLNLRLDGRIKVVAGDVVGRAKIACKGELSLRKSESVVKEGVGPSVFVGTIAGDISVPEGGLALSFIPHAIKNNRELGDGRTLVDQLLEVKGSFHEPLFFVEKRLINMEILGQSSMNFKDDLVDAEMTDFVQKLNGSKVSPKKERLKEFKLESINYFKSRLGSINIGVMQIQ